MNISSYSKVWNLGHKAVENLFDGIVVVEEKVDGSQFSFSKDTNGILHFRSKGCEIHPPVKDKLFKAAVEYVESLKDKLIEGHTYRGEVISKPKHNTLTYGRIPRHGIILFDIDIGDQRYLEKTKNEIDYLDLEFVPSLFAGKVENVEILKELLNKESILGDTKVEGIVIKNYNKYDTFGKTLMGKWVRESFKEQNSTSWKSRNPGKEAVIENLITIYRHENRWKKAIQHLAEQGVLENDPRDISKLLQEVCKDVHCECKDAIKVALWKWAWPKISRGITRGFPEFYKTKLAENQFKPEAQKEIQK